MKGGVGRSDIVDFGRGGEVGDCIIGGGEESLASWATTPHFLYAHVRHFL